MAKYRSQGNLLDRVTVKTLKGRFKNINYANG